MSLFAYISNLRRRADLAAACATSPDYLYQVATGRRRASPRLAERIEESTAALGPFTVTKESIVFAPAKQAEGEAKDAA